MGTDRGDDENPSTRAQREAVRDRYGAIAASDSERHEAAPPDDGGCCTDERTGDGDCCAPDGTAARSRTLGYSDGDLAAAPDGANMGLGCGTPIDLAGLQPGETVLDLGSGGGFDCFLAAQAVGEDGRVVGVDMTPEMVERARENAAEWPHDTVEFRLGEIEHLPVGDERVDVVVSNCVVNLSPAKRQVFAEAFRVLEPGGRLAISDMVATPEGREALDDGDLDQVAGCAAGAATPGELRELLAAAGFEDVSVRPKADSDAVVAEMYDDSQLEDALHSAVIRGRKPAQ